MLSTDKQTNRQTNQRYQKHNLLCQGGNYTNIVHYQAVNAQCFGSNKT